MSSFAELGVSPEVVRALSERGIDAPFPIQRKVTRDVLAGHDVAVKSPTGSGKTLAFGVPLIDRVDRGAGRPSALVLAPTRELAGQIEDELWTLADARGLTVTAVYGGVGITAQAKKASRSDVLIATPGRLQDLVDRRAVTLEHIEILVLDEADRMVDMGFKPAVDRLVALTPRERQTLLFSATLDADVYTRNPRRHEHKHPQEARGRIEHRFKRVLHEAKLDHLVEELRDSTRALVFVRTKRGADRLVKRLSRHDIHAVAMHGDKSQGQRERALSQFERGKVSTLVATDVAARGIDVAGITHVINFDAPAAREDYVHRIGRTARAGADGIGITFVMDDQAGEVGKFATELGLHRELESAGLRSGKSERVRPSRPRRQRSASRRRAG